MFIIGMSKPLDTTKTNLIQEVKTTPPFRIKTEAREGDRCLVVIVDLPDVRSVQECTLDVTQVSKIIYREAGWRIVRINVFSISDSQAIHLNKDFKVFIKTA